jgi:AmmeMemoRadiSam system protein B/AmmeMemoRadiSam system protein A
MAALSSIASRRLAIRTATLASLAVACAAQGGETVREPILAGSWYPGEAGELRTTVEEFLADGGAPDERTIALIAPHAGYVYSGATAGKAFAAVRGRAAERVILLGPSHRAAFNGGALSSQDAWRTPLGEVPLDREAIGALQTHRGFRVNDAAHGREHSLEIEIPFLQVALRPGWKLVPIMVGQLDDETVGELAEGIAPLLGSGTLVVVSSDFTHFGQDYGYVPFRDSVATRIRNLDEEGIAAIRRMSSEQFEDFRERTGATICGADPIRVLLTLMAGRAQEVVQRGYDQSGAMVGSYTNSVSYAALTFAPATSGVAEGAGADGVAAAGAKRVGPHRPLDTDEQEALLALARNAIRAAVRGASAPPDRVPDSFAPDSPLRQERGVFVTLTEGGDLRGCIGSIIGNEPLYAGVRRQAVHAAQEDPRFSPVSPGELERIHIEISVLTPPVPVAGPQEIVVGRHGVLIEKRDRRAVFLPQVAPEQGWDREEMLRALCRKAGLAADDWKSGMTFEVFEAQVFEEKE